jgi:hypothetical protein
MGKIQIINENKATLYVVAFAFCISLLLGFIRGNPAGIVVMRGFLATLLFGVIFQAGVYILRKFIPEMSNLRYAAEEVEMEEADKTEVSTGSVIASTTPDEEEEVSHVTEEEPVTLSSDSFDVNILEEEDNSDEQRVQGEELEDASLSDLPALDSLFEPESVSGEEEKSETHDFPVEEGHTETGDFINVGNARIPNEPKALAKAIKKVMNEE